MPDSDDRIRLVNTLVRHQNMLQAYAYGILRDFHAAEDVYQDLAAIVAEQWESAPAGEGLTAWLREIARRKALETLRKQQRVQPTLPENIIVKLEEHFSGPPKSDSGPGHKDLRSVMAECLGKLERVARLVIQARFCEQLPCDKIAEQIGRSVQSVYSIIKRSRLALTECAERGSTEGRG